jgi:Uma2 family endonuclease
MASITTQLTADRYFKMHFEDLEPEFVRGELIERAMPTFMHAWLTHLLSMRLHGAGFCLIAVRCQLAADVIRIPDLAVFAAFPERVPESPPFVVVEIASPDDRLEELLRKLDQYCTWGVQNIWLVEPELKKLYSYDSRGLTEVLQFELPELNIRVTAGELFVEPNAR